MPEKEDSRVDRLIVHSLVIPTLQVAKFRKLNMIKTEMKLAKKNQRPNTTQTILLDLVDTVVLHSILMIQTTKKICLSHHLIHTMVLKTSPAIDQKIGGTTWSRTVLPQLAIQQMACCPVRSWVLKIKTALKQGTAINGIRWHLNSKISLKKRKWTKKRSKKVNKLH